MGWFADRRVITKILAAVLVVAALGAGVASFGLMEMSVINRSAESVYNGSLQLRTIGEMRNSFNRVRIESLNHFASDDPAIKKDAEEAITAEVARLAEAEARYRTFTLGPTRQAALTEFDTAWSAYLEVLDGKLLPLSRDGNRRLVAVVRKAEIDPLVRTARDAMDTVTARTVEVAQEQTDGASAIYGQARTLVITAIVAGVLIGIVVAVAIARLITGPLSRCVAVLTRIRDGDLTVRTGLTGRDELGLLARALDTSTASVAGMVRQVGDNAHHVAAASEELTAVSTEMSSAAEETSAQAGTVSDAAGEVSRHVQTVAAGAEQMGTSIREIADRATEAATVSGQQTATTTEMARSANEAATSADSIAGTIAGVAEAAGATATGATETSATAQELAQIAEQLRQTIAAYRV